MMMAKLGRDVEDKRKRVAGVEERKKGKEVERNGKLEGQKLRRKNKIMFVTGGGKSATDKAGAGC